MNESTTRLLNRFKALADPARVRLVALCHAAECSVSELTGVTGLSQPRVSQHLKQLCEVDLVERFRDGHFVYYRVPTTGAQAVERRRLIGLLPGDDPVFTRDLDRLRSLRGEVSAARPESTQDRLLHKALVELTVAAPLGDLLDIGCGQGRLLTLLASRARRVVGVDVDPGARRLARAQLLLAGSPNCTLRQGDMYALPFADGEFDTIILDDVLNEADRPTAVIDEAVRLLNPDGRIVVLAAADPARIPQLRHDLAAWAAETGLRLAPPKSIPDKNPDWLLAVAVPAGRTTAAA